MNNRSIKNEIYEINNHLKDIDFELTKLIEMQELILTDLEIISGYIDNRGK